MSEATPIYQKFLTVLNKATRIARGLKIAAIPLLVLNLILGGVGFYYFHCQAHLGHWSWGIPSLIMGIPLISVFAIIWILDSVTCVPAAVESASGEFKRIVQHHRKKLELSEKKKLSKFKYLRIVGKILWEATDVVDGIGMAAFLATPLFWFLYLGAFLGSFILGAVMMLTVLIHYLVS